MDLEVLNQTHPEYSPELWRRIRLLYQGGWQLLKHADEFLDKAPREDVQQYEYRRRCASYVGYFGQLVDFLVGATFGEPPTVAPKEGDAPDPTFYDLLSQDADRAETAFDGVLAQVACDALLFRRSWLAADFPPSSGAATSRADEDALGERRGYVYRLHPEEVLDWGADEQGAVTWAILRREIRSRISPTQKRGQYRIRFKVWEQTSAGAAFVVYETEPLDEGQTVDGQTELRQVIPPSLTRFSRVPLVPVELPHGLWAGNKIGPLAAEFFRRRSELSGSISKSLVSIPFYRMGEQLPSMGGALPADISGDQQRGEDPVGKFERQGYVVGTGDDKLEFVEPGGKAHQSARDELADMRDEIFRSVNAMALSLQSTGANVARSAQSKREDRHSLGIVLGEIARHLKKAARQAYRLISEARGESVDWTVRGFSRFPAADDEQAFIETMERALGFDIPSDTFQARLKTRVAHALVPDASAEEKDAIAEEIEAGVKAHGHDPLAMLEGRLSDDEIDDDDDAGDEDDSDAERAPGSRGRGEPSQAARRRGRGRRSASDAGPRGPAEKRR